MRRLPRQNVSCRCSAGSASVTETLAAHQHSEVVSMRIVTLHTERQTPEPRAAPLTGPDGPKVSTSLSTFQPLFLKRIMEDKRSSSLVPVRLLPPAGFWSCSSSDEVLLGSAQRSWSALQTCTDRFFCLNLRA